MAQMPVVSFFLATQNISRLFNTIDQVHVYNTRSSSRVDYEIKFSRLHKQSKSFSRLGAKIWNCIPPSIRNLQKQSFKKKVHDCLLQILSQTNDYPDLPTLLGHMHLFKIFRLNVGKEVVRRLRFILGAKGFFPRKRTSGQQEERGPSAYILL